MQWHWCTRGVGGACTYAHCHMPLSLATTSANCYIRGGVTLIDVYQRRVYARRRSVDGVYNNQDILGHWTMQVSGRIAHGGTRLRGSLQSHCCMSFRSGATLQPTSLLPATAAPLQTSVQTAARPAWGCLCPTGLLRIHRRAPWRLMKPAAPRLAVRSLGAPCTTGARQRLTQRPAKPTHATPQESTSPPAATSGQRTP